MMHNDHVLNLVVGKKLPRHPDPEVRADLTTPGPACGAWAPRPAGPGVAPFRCSRRPKHGGPHVATLALVARFVAEWDDDRTTDLA